MISQPLFEIDRRKKESVDVQLYNTIVQAINKQLLPSNTLLQLDTLQSFVPELSQERILEILDDVVNAGLARKHNDGYVTLTRKFPHITYHRLEALHDILQAQYANVREEIAQVSITKHYPKKFKDAEFKDRELLCMVQRKYYVHDQLIAFSNTYLPLKMFNNIEKVDFSQGTLYETLQREYPEYSFEYSRRISSVIPSTINVSDVLEVTRNTPVYYGRIHSFTKRYKQFEYCDMYVLANHFTYSREFSTTELKKIL